MHKDRYTTRLPEPSPQRAARLLGTHGDEHPITGATLLGVTQDGQQKLLRLTRRVLLRLRPRLVSPQGRLAQMLQGLTSTYALSDLVCPDSQRQAKLLADPPKHEHEEFGNAGS